MSTTEKEKTDGSASRVPGSFHVETDLQNFDDNNPRVTVDAGVSIYASSEQSTFVCSLGYNVENKVYDLATSTDEIVLTYVYMNGSDPEYMRANSGSATVDWDRAAGKVGVTFDCKSSDSPGFEANGKVDVDISGFPGFNWMTAIVNDASFFSRTTVGFIDGARMII